MTEFGTTDVDAVPLNHRYVACLYWAFTTLTTVGLLSFWRGDRLLGYGDISANTNF